MRSSGIKDARGSSVKMDKVREGYIGGTQEVQGTTRFAILLIWNPTIQHDAGNGDARANGKDANAMVLE